MINLVINGTAYPYPQTGDEPFGDQATNWAIAVTGALIQKSGGTFTLTGDLNFGSSFGLISPYYKSSSMYVAQSGNIRLANTDSIAFRNAANDGDLLLTTSDSGDGYLNYDGTDLADTSTAQTFTNKTLDTGTSITASTALVNNQNATTYFEVNNGTTGTAARASVGMNNDVGVAGMDYPCTGYTSNGPLVANALAISNYGTGGVNIAAQNSSGAIRFWTGGNGSSGTNRGMVSSSGAWTFGDSTSSVVNIKGLSVQMNSAGVSAQEATLSMGAGDGDLCISGSTGSSAGGRVKVYGGTHASKANHVELISNMVTFTMPAADGSAGQVLKTNGSGVWSFITPDGSTLATNINLTGKNTQAASQNIVVSANPATNGLLIVRGVITLSTNALVSGEGFTAAYNSTTGFYTITFSTAFGDVPACHVTLDNNSGTTAGYATTLQSCGTSSVVFFLQDTSSQQVHTGTGYPISRAHILCIGQRA